MAAARRAGVAARTLHVRDACPADAIVGAAQAEDCQLIVMASHGRSGLGRLLLGNHPDGGFIATLELPLEPNGNL